MITHKKEQNVHTAIINPTFNDILTALTILNKNKNVTLCFEEDLMRSDTFFITRFFPRSMANLFSLKSLKKSWTKASSKIAHLIQPEKVLYLENHKISRLKAFYADWILKNTYEKKSLVLPNTKTFPALHDGPGGIFFQEYRINISRLFIELLKYLENKGAIILVNKTIKIYEKTLDVNKHLKINFKQLVKNQTNKIEKPVFTLHTNPNFSVAKKSGNLYYRFSPTSNLLVCDELNQGKSSNVLLAEDFAETIFPEILQYKSSNSFMELNFEVLEQILALVTTGISGAFGSTLPENNYELCLELFDMAKQTGIDYESFKHYYHRFGKQMESITEIVYEKMNQNQDAEKIWISAIDDYEKKNEWKN